MVSRFSNSFVLNYPSLAIKADVLNIVKFWTEKIEFANLNNI